MLPKEEFRLEFQYSELRLERDRKVSPREIRDEIFEYVTTQLGLPENAIEGVVLVNTGWAREKVLIYCADEDIRNILRQQGLELFGSPIDLDLPGTYVIKIEMQGVPFGVPDHLLQEWVSKYGTVSKFEKEKHRLRNGRLTKWYTGTRVAWIKMTQGDVPPIGSVTHEGNEIKFQVWYYGILHMVCRHCKEIVLKGAHTCPQAPMRRCHDCGSFDHIKAECPVGKSCYKCGGRDHISINCVQRLLSVASFASFPELQKGKVQQKQTGGRTADTTETGGEEKEIVNRPGVSGTKYQDKGKKEEVQKHDEEGSDKESSDEEEAGDEKRSEEGASHGGSASGEETSDEIDESTILKGADYKEGKEEVKGSDSLDLHLSGGSDMDWSTEERVVLIGASNSMGLEAHIEDNSKESVKVTNLSKGGKSMTEASDNIDLISSEQGRETDVVIINLGTCDMPKTTQGEIESCYNKFVRESEIVRQHFPKATVVLSSIIPRKGDTQERQVTNQQIHDMNRKLLQLCEENPNHMKFCDNYPYLTKSENGEMKVIEEFYDQKDQSGVHLSPAGKERLSLSLVDILEVIRERRRMAGLATPNLNDNV